VCHTSAQLDAGEYTSVDIADIGTSEDITFGVSTDTTGPNVASNSGIRWDMSGSNNDFRARIYRDGDETANTLDSVPDYPDTTATMYILRNSETSFTTAYEGENVNYTPALQTAVGSVVL